MKVTAALATAPKAPFRIVELDLDDPRPGEVRVRMVASGICHTDTIVRDQWYPTPLPAVLGHEGAGVVDAVGDGVTSVAPGDSVLLSFASCGTCRMCLRAHPAYCVDFFGRNFAGRRPDGSTAFSLDGQPVSSHLGGQSSFASHADVAERSVVKVAPDAPLEVLAPLGCGLQTGAGTILNVLRPEAGASVTVFGAGAVGLAAVLAAAVVGAAPIVAVDVVPDRLDLARRLGATDVVDARDGDVVTRVRRLTSGGTDVAVDTTGSAPVFRQMADSLGQLGRGALVGAAVPGTEASLEIGAFLLSGASLQTVIEGDAIPQEFIPRLVDLHARGLFGFDELVRTYPLERIQDAVDASASGEVVKPVVTF